jgi:FAD/FMN-containing dehydrogenase
MAEKEELINIVGAENVYDAPDVLKQYAGDRSFVPPVTPACAVRPKNMAEVQATVQWANRTSTPLVPLSSGPPHFHGGTVPSTEGAVIVDLSGMKRIIRVDGGNRVAMVEPGVTFAELQPVLGRERLRLNMPLLPRTSKSVIGSALEREPVIMPKYHWDIADPLLCTEVIFGSGDLFRTGSAAGPGTLEEQWAVGMAQEVASGPSQADWYRVIQGAQGTMGIVTWATVRCERLPRLEEAFLVGSPALDGISELAHWLIRLRLVNECLVLNNTNLAAILTGARSHDYETLRDSLPPWVLLFCIAGYEYFPEERVAYQTDEMLAVARRAGVAAVKVINRVSATELLSVLRTPSAEPYWKLRGNRSCADLFFLTTRDKLSELIGVMSDLAVKHGYPLPDMGVYIQPIVQGTSCHCEFNLFFNPGRETEADTVRKLLTEAVPALMERGAFFSRPYGPWADEAYRRDAGTTAALRKLKGIFDPNGIMNPGKLCF